MGLLLAFFRLIFPVTMISMYIWIFRYRFHVTAAVQSSVVKPRNDPARRLRSPLSKFFDKGWLNVEWVIA